MLQEKASWRASELAKLMELPLPKLRMGAVFWINQGPSLSSYAFFQCCHHTLSTTNGLCNGLWLFVLALPIGAATAAAATAAAAAAATAAAAAAASELSSPGIHLI